ncbi:MAG: hypothetical protein BWY74_02376 [Firmicutes bacterium ADurb.Bin419]|nr:MAG: hypothetical protein BWY74_02376 [Firmicutes bacterium ADurb.Bin419]
MISNLGVISVVLSALFKSRRPYPNFSSFPSSPKSRAESVRYCSTSIMEREGFLEIKSAQAAATNGVAIDVPSYASYIFPGSVLKTFTPGAEISTVEP